MLFLGSLLIGLVVGFVGFIRNWSTTKIVAVALIFSYFLSIFIIQRSQSQDFPISKLKQVTKKTESGTAFTVRAPSGLVYLMTNWHVCFFEKSKDILKVDKSVDLCILPWEKDNIGVEVARHLSFKESIYTYGFPKGRTKASAGYNLGEEEWTYPPFGITYRDNLTNLYAEPGSSGSPVVNLKGELVGVVSSSDNLNTAGMVSLDNIKKFLKGL